MWAVQSNGPLVSGTNSPQNFAGATGTIDASGGGSLPGVPDGVTGTPLKANKLAADGSSISVSWDAALCSDSNQHQILYGQRSGFPALAGGTYTLQGGTCSIGSASPYTWNATPSAVDGSGLTWFLVVTKDASGAEGPWGTYNGTTERTGPGTGGSSGVCSTTSKTVSVAVNGDTVVEPNETFVVNLSGAFALGVVTGAALDDDVYRLVATGLLGGYTTFSTWMFESQRLGEDGELRLGLVNLIAPLVLGVIAVWVGRAL